MLLLIHLTFDLEEFVQIFAFYSIIEKESWVIYDKKQKKEKNNKSNTQKI